MASIFWGGLNRIKKGFFGGITDLGVLFSNLSGLVWTVKISEKVPKKIVWTGNILSVFGTNPSFSNLSELVWIGPISRSRRLRSYSGLTRP